MSKPYSNDLRTRVIESVESEGLSRHQAAARFSIGVSTAIRWVDRYQATGSVAPRRIGGYKPKKISGAHRAWLLERCRASDFTLRGLVSELAGRGLKVDYRSVWAFVHAEKMSFKKRRWSPASKIGRMSPANGCDG
jgi:putative transposase